MYVTFVLCERAPHTRARRVCVHLEDHEEEEGEGEERGKGDSESISFRFLF